MSLLFIGTSATPYVYFNKPPYRPRRWQVFADVFPSIADRGFDQEPV